MLFAWLRYRERRRILAQPFPPAWLEYLRTNVGHYGYLAAEEQGRLRDELRVFIAEKNWEGCGGLRITDEIQVTVAAHACLLTLNLDPTCFDRVLSVLVYPHGYRAPEGRPGPAGVIDMRGQARLGEAWYRGPVVLAWDQVLYDGRHPGQGRNLVFHEFAHQLDMLDGLVDGTPPLRSRDAYHRWAEVMTAEHRRLADVSEYGGAALLDRYGLTNEAEFFAVATECFFDRPAPLRRQHPRLYEVLREYYRQDPARRLPGGWNE